MNWEYIYLCELLFSFSSHKYPERELLDHQLGSVQWLSRVPLFATPWTTAHQGLPVHHQLLESTQTHVQQVSDATQPSHPPSSPSPPALNLSQHQGLFNESALRIRWPKYWSFSFNNSPSNEHPGLISFRIDWLDLLVVQGLSRVFSNTTVQKHQFFSAQLSLSSNSHIHTCPREKP